MTQIALHFCTLCRKVQHLRAAKARMHEFATRLKRKATEQRWTSVEDIPETGQKLLNFFRFAFQGSPEALQEAFRGTMFAQGRAQGKDHAGTLFMGQVLVPAEIKRARARRERHGVVHMMTSPDPTKEDT